MPFPITALTQLLAVRALLTPSVWTQGATARDKRGVTTTVRVEDGNVNPRAVQFCLYGALMHTYAKADRCGHGPAYEIVGELLLKRGYSRSDTPLFNDEAGRTLEDIHALLDEAIAQLQG